MSSEARGSEASPPAEPTALPEAWQAAIWMVALVHVLIGIAIVLAILRQRGAADPWIRVDRYVVAFLVAGSVAGIGQAVFFLRAALRSLGVAGEALGLTYDPAIVAFFAVIEIGKLATAFDYARWQLVPALELAPLRGLGVALGAAGSAYLVWTDRRLARHFSTAESAALLMTGGPYRWVRHPRYASMLLLGASMALVFASVVGWLVFVVIALAVQHRIAREEPHLRREFGAAYERYASHTARLVPGLY
ncbi:MAG TPA: isoprenylcysteine carboxylmethyltransferase family protein [Candidatus Binatia bacterium]|nr:isoprenylcysteine carboxylmethyltransferase family protein [Candidatus Binatia bacterium]